MSLDVLASLDLHPRLTERITESVTNRRGTPAQSESLKDSTEVITPPALLKKSFVLYLPTVLLRYKQNPAFSVACHVANHFGVPLVVLATVLDDASIPPSHRLEGGKTVVMTARRLAFVVEALSQCAAEWADHGACVAVRVHAPGCRAPDHLTLAVRASAVVTDEPFVHPHLAYVRRVERACLSAGVMCFRVDGSTTIPPAAVLKRLPEIEDSDDAQYYSGVPAKAWMWQKKTESRRMGHIRAAMDGAFDAPTLDVKMSMDDFSIPPSDQESSCEMENNLACLRQMFPCAWQDIDSPAPGRRPWTISELKSLRDNIKDWAMNWPGSDASVPPCSQTVGTTAAGECRWNDWVRNRNGLKEYARRRNDPRQPHSPSRMSCYLNMGIVSIFRLVHEVKSAQSSGVQGANKFEEEIVKWREMSYAHAFSRGDYDGLGSLPGWAIRSLDECSANATPLALDRLEKGATNDCNWNAMQQYLVKTGELHNNARMTWGKTVVHWGAAQKSDGKTGDAATEILRTLCYLNDRFALDGLSPPSYAGLLWCMGWSDKPSAGNRISQKPAHKYRVGPAGFWQAERLLLENNIKLTTQGSQVSILDMLSRIPQPKRQKTIVCE